MNVNFSEQLKKAMNARGLKQVDLANELRITEGTVSHYLSGYCKPKTERVFAVANALGVRAGWLVFGEGPMEDKADEQPKK